MNAFKLIFLTTTLLFSQAAFGFGFGPDNPDEGFANIDINKDGMLSQKEFLEHGPNPPFISTKKIFERIDADQDLEITKQEFVDAWHNKRGKPNK